MVDVVDDGVGLPEGFDASKQESLGLAIITTLITDLGGTMELGPREDGAGTLARLRIPVTVG